MTPMMVRPVFDPLMMTMDGGKLLSAAQTQPDPTALLRTPRAAKR